MPRPSSETLTHRESQIMELLWADGPATADEIREALPADLHDSTVRTLLRVLESKGYVGHARKGRAFVFHATLKRSSAERKAVRSLIQRLFGGSAEALVMRLIEDEQLTPEQLDQLKKKLNSSKRR